MAARGMLANSKVSREEFIEALAETGNVSVACKSIGASRRAMYHLREKDEAFAAAWNAALEMGADALEDEANRRAREGVEEPVFYRGTCCGYVRRYSDVLLMFLLKGLRPHKYRDHYIAPPTNDEEAIVARIRQQLAALRGSLPAGGFAAILTDETLAAIAATGDVEREIGRALIAADTDPERREPAHAG
jgi:hypothetical protein